MSLDRSLKSASSLVRHRNVLTRAERLDKLKEVEKWDESKPVFGLPKVGHRKQEVGKAVKEETTEGAAATPAAAGAKPAAGAKGAATAAAGAKPATGAKGATPAAAAPAKKGK
jgi:small basic protein (TIGR04137 family)